MGQKSRRAVAFDGAHSNSGTLAPAFLRAFDRQGWRMPSFSSLSHWRNEGCSAVPGAMPKRPRSVALALGLDLAQQSRDEVEEQPNSRCAALTRAEEHVDGWAAPHLPIQQHRYQAPGLQVDASRQVIEASDPFASKHAVEYDFSTAAAKPTIHLHRHFLGTALELPQVNQDSGGIANEHAGVLIELVRMPRDAARRPVFGRSDDQRSRVTELAMDEVVRLRPAMKNKDVRDLCIGIRQSVDHADIDPDVGVERMESRQCRQQHMKRQLRVGSNHQRSCGSLRGPAKRLVDSHQLGKQWTACLEVGFPARSQRQAARAALK